MSLPSAWSFSSIKSYVGCPKKYYHLKVVKDHKEDQQTEAILYGKTFHKAAEDFIKDGVPLPEQFKYAAQYLNTIASVPGDKYCEFEMGLRQDLTPCGFRDPGVWVRGIADIIVVKNDVARVLDYKTGKSAKYADLGQLELMALMIFKHFPDVKKVRGGLLFVVAGDFRKEDYTVDKEHIYWRNWMPLVQRLETSHKTGVWNPNKTGLCKAHCPITSCQHNGANANGIFR